MFGFMMSGRVRSLIEENKKVREEALTKLRKVGVVETVKEVARKVVLNTKLLYTQAVAAVKALTTQDVINTVDRVCYYPFAALMVAAIAMDAVFNVIAGCVHSGIKHASDKVVVMKDWVKKNQVAQ